MSNLEWFFIIYDSFFILEFSTSCHALPILFHGLLYLSQARQPLDSLVNTQASQWSTTTRTQETTYRDSRPRVGTGTRGRSKVESGQGHRAPRGRPRLSVRPLHMDWNVGRTTQWPLCSSFIASSVHLYHTRAYIYHTCVFTWTYLWDHWFLRMLKIFILVQLYSCTCTGMCEFIWLYIHLLALSILKRSCEYFVICLHISRKVFLYKCSYFSKPSPIVKGLIYTGTRFVWSDTFVFYIMQKCTKNKY